MRPPIAPGYAPNGISQRGSYAATERRFGDITHRRPAGRPGRLPVADSRASCQNHRQPAGVPRLKATRGLLSEVHA